MATAFVCFYVDLFFYTMLLKSVQTQSLKHKKSNRINSAFPRHRTEKYILRNMGQVSLKRQLFLASPPNVHSTFVFVLFYCSRKFTLLLNFPLRLIEFRHNSVKTHFFLESIKCVKLNTNISTIRSHGFIVFRKKTYIDITNILVSFDIT